MTLSEQQARQRSIPSERSAKLGVSGIRLIFEKAQSIPDVIRLEFGEPDFDTPKNIKDAAISAISRGKTKYTPGAGIPELRRAISTKLENENSVFYDPEKEVVVTAGATAGLNLALLATLDPGDEILIPNPGWATYEYAVSLVGARAVPYNLESGSGYSFPKEDVKQSITEKTKALLINSPSNPMGSVFSRRDIISIADLSKEYDLTVLADEVYEKFLYSGNEDGKTELGHISIASLPEMKRRTVTINSFSKTYAMTGWRVGYVASTEGVARAMAKINTAASSCISSISQFAALEAISGPQDSVKEMIKTYRERRDVIVRRLNEIPGFSCEIPKGAFYAFPDVHDTRKTSFDLAMSILEKAHVATVPGSAFGSKGEGHLRLAYANSLKNIELALDRISSIF